MATGFGDVVGGVSTTARREELGSKWEGLHDKLVARMWTVTRDIASGKCSPLSEQAAPVVVRATVTDGSIEQAEGWQSPFENSGTLFPTLQNLLSSGALPFADKPALAQFEGRTGLTKLNSTQVYNTAQPLKLQLTLLFRAWADPVKEVEAPFAKIMSWSLPQKLEPDGLLLSRLGKDFIKNGLSSSTLLQIMPSKSPALVAFQYKNTVYAPMVVENIGYPLTAPIDRNGNHTELPLTLTLCSLTALDRLDWESKDRRVGGI